MFKKLLLSLLAIFGFTLFLFSGNTYADVQDVTVTIDSSTAVGTYICGGNSGVNCSLYSFWYVERDFDSSSGYIALRSQYGINEFSTLFPFTSSSLLYEFSSSGPGISSLRLYDKDGLSSGRSVTVTLTNTNPSGGGGITPTGTLNISENGSYDVTNYATAVVNVPNEVTEIIEDPISNDFQKVFFAIVEKIIPAFGILLVVWFGIDMLSSLIFGRGR